MNRYIMIHRLRAPGILLLIGVLALLHQAGILACFWGWFVPLLLIMLGLLLLAERAALAAEGGYPPMPYPGAPDPRGVTGVPPYPGQPVPFVRDPAKDARRNTEGGLL